MSTDINDALEIEQDAKERLDEMRQEIGYLNARNDAMDAYAEAGDEGVRLWRWHGKDWRDHKEDEL